MTTEHAVKLIDVKHLFRHKHKISYETSDKTHDLTNFSTCFIASVDFADKMKTIPELHPELLDFRSTGMATTTELLLSKQIGQLGDSGYNSTFRTVFLTAEHETTFNSVIHKKCVSVLIQDARTKISQTDSTTCTHKFFLVDQIEAILARH